MLPRIIQQTVLDVLVISEDDLRNSKQIPYLTRARKYFCYFMYTYSTMSIKDMAFIIDKTNVSVSQNIKIISEHVANHQNFLDDSFFTIEKVLKEYGDRIIVLDENLDNEIKKDLKEIKRIIDSRSKNNRYLSKARGNKIIDICNKYVL